MKKILIFLGIFIFTFFIFGEDKYNDEAVVNITAEFFAPITVTTTDASFGTIIVGNAELASTKAGSNPGAQNGTLNITADSDVRISWKDTSTGNFISPNKGPLTVVLKHSNGDKTLLSTFRTYYPTDRKFDIDSINPTYGSIVEVIGELTIPNTVTTGTYSGSIIFRVAYQDKSIHN